MLDIIITTYENYDDSIGNSTTMKVSENLTVKQLRAKLAKKYKAFVEEFYFDDVENLNEKLSSFKLLEGYFFCKDESSIDIYMEN